MNHRQAACACGQLQLTCSGDPVRVSVCHCLDCQRRTGSAFGAQARFAAAHVVISGPSQVFMRVGDSGGTGELHFCPVCGSTVWWSLDSVPGFVSVALGAFADPAFPAPAVSVYVERRHPWVQIGGPAAEHFE